MTSLKFWDGTQWIELGSVPGPQGAQGVIGLTGPTGPTGPTAVVAQPGTPGSTSVLWVDTDDPDPNPYAVEAIHIVGTAGEPALAAGWSTYAAGWPAASYYKDSQGRVFINGMIKKSSAVIGGETLWTLPAGYRPLTTQLFAVQSNGLGRVDVQPGGTVIVTTGSNAWLSLAGLNFRVDQ